MKLEVWSLSAQMRVISYIYTPLKTNMTMKKQPFEDVSPINNWVIFQPAM